MRVAIDLTSLHDNFSGIERYAMNMALEILKQNTDFEIDLLFKGEVHEVFRKWENDKRVHVHVLPVCSKLFFYQWRLPRYLRKLTADYYLFFAFPMPICLRKKHVIGTIHDMACWDCSETMKFQMKWYFRISDWWMSKRAEKIITISDFSKSRICEILHVKEESIVVAYCGISSDFEKVVDLTEEKRKLLQKKYHLPQEYYLSLSTLEPRKNLSILLKAYLELYQKKKVSVPLVLAGRTGWKVDAMMREIDQSEDQQIVATGFIDDADLPYVYRMAKCFVFPSIYEGFGIPPVEAMAQKIPVIASDSSCLPEILGEGAVYFQNNNLKDLCAGIMKFENMSEKEQKLVIERGFQRSQGYRYQNEAKKIIRIIGEQHQ